MRAYSMDLRERALLDSDAGMKAADVAAKYRVSGSWVRLLKQRRRETGEVAPRVQRHGRRCMLEPHLHTLAALIAAQPDRTLAELKDALATPASVPTVWRAVRALGLTVKKKAISEFPKERKYLISLSFLGKSSVRPAQVGRFDVNIVIHGSTAVRGRGDLVAYGWALWKLPAPWTHRTRPPHLGKRCAFFTSFHRAFPIKSFTKNPERPKNSVGKPG